MVQALLMTCIKNLSILKEKNIDSWAGSAVESILYKLYNSRPEHITIINRTKEKQKAFVQIIKIQRLLQLYERLKV